MTVRLTNGDLRKLHEAGVTKTEILRHYKMVSAENLRQRERRIGLPPRRPGARPLGTPSVAEVLKVEPCPKPFRPLSPQEVRRKIILAMKPGKEYLSSDLAEILDLDHARIRTNTGYLVRIRILKSKIVDRHKNARSYQLNMKD